MPPISRFAGLTLLAGPAAWRPRDPAFPSLNYLKWVAATDIVEHYTRSGGSERVETLQLDTHWPHDCSPG
jgi:hypothetical protein